MKISESEMELMRVIWSRNAELTSAEISDELRSEWKPTTIMTFLKRLCDKGALNVRKEGKTNFYSAKITEEEYKRARTEEFIEELHHGSLMSLLASLTGGKRLNQKELSEIKKWFDEL